MMSVKKPSDKSLTVDDSNGFEKAINPEKGKKTGGKAKPVTKRTQSRQTAVETAENSSGAAGRSQTGQKHPDNHTSRERSTSPVTDNNAQILSILQNIQINQNEQANKLNDLSARMADYENNYDQDDDYDDDYYDQNDQQDNNLDLNDDNNANKRKAPDDDEQSSTSRFAAMAKRYKTREVCSPPIDSVLAQNLNDLFRNGMNEDQFNELTKDEINPRPENCEGLVQVKTNQLVWDLLSARAQTNDRKLQTVQKAIVKASTMLVKVVDDMAKADNNNNNEHIDTCNDVLAILGHANKKVNLTRRDLMRPEMQNDYAHLCSHSVEFTSFLFGDDVSKTAKQIEDCSKISYKIGRGGRRGSGYFYGRGRGGRRGRGARGGRGVGRGRGQATRNYEAPKNALKRAGSSNKE